MGFFGGARIEIIRDNLVRAKDVEDVISSSKHEIVLRMQERYIAKICGRELTIRFYFKPKIEISGRIEEIKFEKEKIRNSVV